MLDITINKKLLDSYRDYKIDLIEDKVEERIIFKVLEHIISSGLKSLSDLTSELSDYESIIVCAITGEVKVKNNKYRHEEIAREQLEEYLKHLGVEKKPSKWGGYTDGTEDFNGYKVKYYGDEK